MNPTHSSLRRPFLALVLLTAAQPALPFSASTSASAFACSPALVDSDGGNGFDASVSSVQVSGDCGPLPGDDGAADSAGYADIANAVVFVSGSAHGPSGSNLSNSFAELQDFLFLEAPAGVDTVRVRVALDFIADYTGAYEFSPDLLSGLIQIQSIGDLMIRRCTPIICPDDPIQSDSATAEFDVPRNAFSNEFPQISVSLTTAMAVVNGGGYFRGTASVEIVDDSGATISSQSGKWGTGDGFDRDADGIVNALDNCSLHSNPDQRDSNGDGFGNRCDPDLNDDLEVNFVDLGQMKSVFFSADDDADLDGDGNVNFSDLGIMKAFIFGSPGPGAEL